MTEEPVETARVPGLDAEPLLEDHPVGLRIAIGLWAFSALLFVTLAIPGTADVVQWVDDAVHRWVVAVEFGPAVGIAKVFDFLGSVWVTLPLIVGIGAWLAWRRRWEAFSAWVVAMIVSQLMIGPIKDLYARPRPSLPLVTTTSWSFPSGHSVATAAIAIGAVIVLVRPGPKRRNLEMLAGAFAVVMALSRVYLRAHWLTDVAAGAALGAAIVIGAAALMHWLDERRRTRIDRKPELESETG